MESLKKIETVNCNSEIISLVTQALGNVEISNEDFIIISEYAYKISKTIESYMTKTLVEVILNSYLGCFKNEGFLNYPITKDDLMNFKAIPEIIRITAYEFEKKCENYIIKE